MDTTAPASPSRAPEPAAPGTAVATVVVSDAVTKVDALQTLSVLTDARIVGERTASPPVPLADGAWAEIEIPKFGEAPPLAIDVHAADEAVARAQARAVIALLRDGAGWTVHGMFPDA
ncbi:hypothetical protein [Microbacterium aurantiacum]|uniref:hypothetical protein n=1 Tax=Microbacterium aurantiacum TaxID=162393 RepID=UPI0007DAA1CF|nr:hypothetical protein [Microbacterium chocolatum]ANG86406.1 hypothetical protein A8L33_14520 [Microbacterium chocolatum]